MIGLNWNSDLPPWDEPTKSRCSHHIFQTISPKVSRNSSLSAFWISILLIKYQRNHESSSTVKRSFERSHDFIFMACPHLFSTYQILCFKYIVVFDKALHGVLSFERVICFKSCICDEIIRLIFFEKIMY